MASCSQSILSSLLSHTTMPVRLLAFQATMASAPLAACRREAGRPCKARWENAMLQLPAWATCSKDNLLPTPLSWCSRPHICMHWPAYMHWPACMHWPAYDARNPASLHPFLHCPGPEPHRQKFVSASGVKRAAGCGHSVPRLPQDDGILAGRRLVLGSHGSQAAQLLACTAAASGRGWQVLGHRQASATAWRSEPDCAAPGLHNWQQGGRRGRSALHREAQRPKAFPHGTAYGTDCRGLASASTSTPQPRGKQISGRGIGRPRSPAGLLVAGEKSGGTSGGKLGTMIACPMVSEVMTELRAVARLPRLAPPSLAAPEAAPARAGWLELKGQV